MKVCLACGTIFKAQADVCGHCTTPFTDNTGEAPVPFEGACFARMLCHFKCRSCGHKVALNGLDDDGSVMCGNCGIDQMVERDMWADILTHAHNTADFAGWNKPAEDTPVWKAFVDDDRDIAAMYYNIGESRSALEMSNGGFGDVAYTVEVSPGHPVCPSCHKIFEISLDGETLRATCPGCATAATYEIPAHRREYGDLVGVISNENRTDTPAVKTEDASGGAALSITCPECGGALENPKAGDICTCPYCHVACHIPARIYQKATGAVTEPTSWWALFKGDSAVHKQAKKDAEKQAHRAALERRRRIAEIDEEERRRQAEHSRNLLLVVLILAVLAGVVAAVLLAN